MKRDSKKNAPKYPPKKRKTKTTFFEENLGGKRKKKKKGKKKNERCKNPTYLKNSLFRVQVGRPADDKSGDNREAQTSDCQNGAGPVEAASQEVGEKGWGEIHTHLKGAQKKQKHKKYNDKKPTGPRIVIMAQVLVRGNACCVGAAFLLLLLKNNCGGAYIPVH